MNRFLIIFFIISTLFINACKKSSKIEVVNTNFSEVIECKTNLLFEFNREIIPDTMINKIEKDKCIKIEPEVKGILRWYNTTTIAFIPETGFSPATDYKVTITSKILKYSKKFKLSGKKVYNVKTPDLEFTSYRIYWKIIDELKNQIAPILELTFNYEVDPSKVGEKLELSSDKTQYKLKLKTTLPSKEISFIIENVEPSDDDIKFKFLLKKGLKPIGGTNEIKKDEKLSIILVSPYNLGISSVYSEHDGVIGQIIVNLSQKVNEKNLKNHIVISPTIKYDIEVLQDQLIIKSKDFVISDKYELKILKGLTGVLGGVLKENYITDIIFSKLQPALKFYDKSAVYLSSQGSKTFEIVANSINEFDLEVYKIYENNILPYLNKENDYYYDDDLDEYVYYKSEPYNLGDLIYSCHYKVNDLKRNGNLKLLTLDFNDKLKNYKGIYYITISSNNPYFRDSKVISISDLGIIVKEGILNYSIFINSIASATPVPDAEVYIIGRNNQILTKLTTDKNGYAYYEYSQLPAKNFVPELIYVKKNEDFNFINLKETRINLSRFDVGGRYDNPSGLEIFLYGDRDLYRPGDTLNITGVVREYSSMRNPGYMPLEIDIISPNGKIYQSFKKTLNEEGSFEVNVPTTKAALTGTYTVEVYTMSSVMIGSREIKVEEFVPDRIKVKVNLNKEEYKSGDEMVLNIDAMSFYGPPAANRNYEVELTTVFKKFNSSDFKDYNFNLCNVNQTFEKILRENKTNSEGKAIEKFKVPIEFKNNGLLQYNFFVTVFDETGRPVNRKKVVDVYTQDIFLGIKTESYYARTKYPVYMNLVAVDKYGKSTNNVKARVDVVRYEYKTVLNQGDSYYRYRSEKVEKVIDSKTITISGETNFNFTPDVNGSYEVRLYLPGANTYVKEEFWAYGYGSITQYSSFEVNKEGEITIEFDKPVYNPGDKAKILFKAPFSGKILVTLEDKKVIKYFYIETDKRVATLNLDITENYLPNVYISATLFRPHGVSELPLTVAHGYAPLYVEDSDNKLPIDINCTSESRSNRKQTILVKTLPGAYVTIAAVDNGILQVTDYKTPQPYSYFYAKKALCINTYNIYPWLFPEISKIESSTGGDEESMEKRVNPLSNERIKLVSFWSGIQKANNKGEVQFDIDIPQFSGEIKVMAVGYKNKKFGSTDKFIKVADPIVINTALPRFLSPGDSLIVPVILNNTTKNNIKGNVNIKVEGPVEVIGQNKKDVIVDANSEKEVLFNIAVKQVIGQAKIDVIFDTQSEKFENHTDIAVRPASSLVKVFQSGIVKSGESKKIDIEENEFIQSSIEKKLIVSKSPLIQFNRNIEYLVQYPYGCVEQTVSKAFPQLYFSDLVKELKGSILKDELSPIKNIQYAIDRLKTMQLYNGGLTFWPGGSSETWYGSVYAAHFLVEAQKAGYVVDNSMLEGLLLYLKNRLKKKEYVDFYYDFNKKVKIFPREAIYSLYVLALAGKPDISAMNFYKAEMQNLSQESKYLLAASYMLVGDKSKYKEILPQEFERKQYLSETGGSFSSPLRDEALALNVLLEVDPDNPQIGIMAKHVSEELMNNKYLNTQENCFGFVAIGKIAKNTASANAYGIVKVNNKVVGKIENNTLTLKTNKLNGDKVIIEASGSGNLYYFYSMEGIPVKGWFKEEDNYLKVRKRIYDRNGTIANLKNIKQTELLLIELSIQTLNNTYIENVVITDLLPACFEIENPRLTELPPGMSTPFSRSYPEYQDIRDDRINLFVTATPTVKYYYYLIRTVSPGTFLMGPVCADAMYKSEYHSYSGSGIVKVVRK